MSRRENKELAKTNLNDNDFGKDNHTDFVNGNDNDIDIDNDNQLSGFQH